MKLTPTFDPDPRWVSGASALLAFYPGDGIILDMGCGRRPITQKAITIDQGTAMTNLETMYPWVVPHIEGSFSDPLPFKDRSVAMVCSIDTIEHSVDPLATLDEWVRVLRPGGVLGLLVPHKDKTPVCADHNHSWTPTTFHPILEHVKELCEVIGFEPVLCDWWFAYIFKKRGCHE